jgi:hypothetical protein
MPVNIFQVLFLLTKLGASGSQNGTSTCPNSNIFMTSSTYSALTGKNNIYIQFLGTTAIPSADAIPANILGKLLF